MNPRRLRIAWFSQLVEPGASPSSISEYCSDLLLPILKDRFEIETFSSSFSTPYPWIRHNHHLNAYKRHRERPFDIFFYQLEDGTRSRFTRTQIGMVPGISWIHDIFLGDLGAEATHTSPWEHTIAQFHDENLPFEPRGHLPHQLRPHAYREVSVSPVVLFDSYWGLKEFRSLVSNRIEHELGAHRAEFVPVPVSLRPIRPVSKKSDLLSVVTPCSPGVEGHSHKMLPALKALKQPWRLTWMVSAEELSRANGLIDEFDVRERVTLVEGRTTGAWERALEGADVAVHLHNSPFGHLGPYLHLSMAAGVPCVALRAAAGEELPRDAVFSIEGGMFETAQMVGIFEQLARGDLLGCGDVGRRYIVKEAGVNSIAQKLGDLFVESAPNVAPIMERWNALYKRGWDALVQELVPLVDTADSVAPSPFEALVKPFIQELNEFSRNIVAAR